MKQKYKELLYPAFKETKKCPIGECYCRYKVLTELGCPGDKITEGLFRLIDEKGLTDEQQLQLDVMEYMDQNHRYRNRQIFASNFAEDIAKTVFAVLPSAAYGVDGNDDDDGDDDGELPSPGDPDFLDRCDQLGICDVCLQKVQTTTPVCACDRAYFQSYEDHHSRRSSSSDDRFNPNSERFWRDVDNMW